MCSTIILCAIRTREPTCPRRPLRGYVPRYCRTGPLTDVNSHNGSKTPTPESCYPGSPWEPRLVPREVSYSNKHNTLHQTDITPEIPSGSRFSFAPAFCVSSPPFSAVLAAPAAACCCLNGRTGRRPAGFAAPSSDADGCSVLIRKHLSLIHI